MPWEGVGVLITSWRASGVYQFLPLYPKAWQLFWWTWQVFWLGLADPSRRLARQWLDCQHRERLKGLTSGSRPHSYGDSPGFSPDSLLIPALAAGNHNHITILLSNHFPGLLSYSRVVEKTWLKSGKSCGDSVSRAFCVLRFTFCVSGSSQHWSLRASRLF